MVNVVEGSTLENFSQGGSVTIDLKSAEEIAKKYDFTGRDLAVHLDFDLGSESPVNFIVIDPVLFGTNVFMEVLDIATLNANGEFETVDGFDSQSFDKVLTPEANKVINDDVISKTLAPSQYSYGGLGVFAFPLRLTTKIRATLMVRDPVPAFYERLYVLTQEVGRANV